MNKRDVITMISKLLNKFVKPKFPEIFEIKVKYIDILEFFQIDVLVDGTDQEQENEITDIIENILKYTGENIRFQISFHIEYWGNN